MVSLSYIIIPYQKKQPVCLDDWNTMMFIEFSTLGKLQATDEDGVTTGDYWLDRLLGVDENQVYPKITFREKVYVLVVEYH
jgi:hypothetical protein